jgi:hypothetical protein
VSERPLRIVFFLLHAGYIRYYRPVLETLAGRGHSVELAFSRLEKDAGDSRLADELAAANPRITIGLAPQRARGDGWRAFSGLVRALTDLSRYAHPRYAGSPALRARVARKITDHVRSASGIDPITARLSLLLVRFVSTRSSEAAARRLGRGFALLEEALPASARITHWLEQRKPDVVLASPVIDFASTQVEYLKSARTAGIPAALCVASWDNLTGKGLVRVVPDRMFVWNEIQRREAHELHGVPLERVVATGSPKFDEWFDREPRKSSAELAAASGLPLGPYVLYLCSSPFIAPDEVSFVRDWLRALRANGLDQLGVLVRPHPQNAAQWRSVDLEDERAVVWPRAGAQPDEGEARADFFDSIWHSAAVVGVNTSALIESAIVGKSVFTVLDARFAGTQEGTLHFHYLRVENGGFLHEARSLEEHARQLAAGIADGDASETRTRHFVQAFVRPHGLQGSATPILADEIERLATVVPAPARTRTAARAVRGLLTPIALFGALSGPASRLARRLLRARPGPTVSKPPPELRYEQVEPSEAIRRVDEELRALAPAAVAGPWRGGPASELLIWLPFLRAAARRHKLDLAVVPAGPRERYAGFRLAEGDATLDPSLAERLVAGFLAGTEPIAPLLERLDFAPVLAEDVGAVVVEGAGEDLQIAVAAGRPTVALLTPEEAAGADIALTYRAARALGTPLTILAPEQAGLAAAIGLSASPA